MADQPHTMRPVDHVLAHALTALVAIRVHDPARDAMLRTVLEQDWAHTQSPIPEIQALAETAGHLLSCAPGSPAWARAHLNASDAVARFSEWRLGKALAAHQAKGSEDG